MSDKVFIGLIAVILVAFGGFIYQKKSSQPSEAIIGIQHKEQGKNHISRGQEHEPYNSEPASSGPHYADGGAPAPWGVYTEEVPEEVFLHNEEHGGVIVTYHPDLLPADQLKKLQALFAPPYSDKSFKPSKAIVTPRPKNTKAIQLAAWTYTLNLDEYDKETIRKFYLQRVGKAPEGAAGPNNAPINQAAEQ